MTNPTVKAIKGCGPQLSLAQLEKASARLLIARIRGHEPQISFNFVQRLLDELIRRRRDEELLQLEVNRVAEPEESAPQVLDVPSGTDASADFDTLITADFEETPESLDTTPANAGELEIPEEVVLDEDSPLWDMAEDHEEEDEEEAEEPPTPSRPKKRRAVLACSRPRNSVLQGELNAWRVVVVSLLAIFAMVVGVILMGCGR